MEDSEKARQAMEEALRRGKVGNYSVDRSYIRFEWEPGLSIQGLEASEMMPAVEGTELSLACIVQGSSGMKVAWLKDGAPININTTYRTLWTNIVPKNSKKQYTALLGFDTTTVLDSGIFTCQVDDWGLVQNKSFEVIISSVPKPLLKPLTATVQEGDNLTITCLSQVSAILSLTYPPLIALLCQSEGIHHFNVNFRRVPLVVIYSQLHIQGRAPSQNLYFAIYFSPFFISLKRCIC